MINPFTVVKQFEDALCEYTGAPYCITTTSCTMALLLAMVYHKVDVVELPKFTYVGVAQSVLNAGGKIAFRDEDWTGWYQLKPYPIWDSAKWVNKGMYMQGQMICLSFHWQKTLGIQQGGCILTDDAEAADMLRRMRFDGRTEGVAPTNDKFVRGYHAYMSPETAAQGIVRLSHLPERNYPLPNDPYPDLSKCEIFK